MPSKNRVKVYVADTYYHLYNRGVDKMSIFRDDTDYAVFLNLLKRYLDAAPATDGKGRQYECLYDKLELLAFCLMPNHYHLLIYLDDPEAMTRLLRGVCISYTGYFNKKYRRIGPLFQDRYKASPISEEPYLQHISRYIHLNPKNYIEWPYSSLQYYLGSNHAEWVQPQKILDLFEGEDYLEFLRDYENHKAMLDEIKKELAD